ncbi:hypothetical protein, partial [Flavobacterium sp.]|uniref:hypothetical protein n=1 Tax=Flavobacterium sp. TaxID=239 RepID=UPI003262F68B
LKNKNQTVELPPFLKVITTATNKEELNNFSLASKKLQDAAKKDPKEFAEVVQKLDKDSSFFKKNK